MKKLIMITWIFSMLLFQACYYDNMEDLFPDGGSSCDTTNVTFSETIMPLLQANCTGCHSGAAPSGNISIENYDDVVILAENGSLMGSIRFESGYSSMPKGGSKLSDCDISKLEKWIADGMVNN